MRFSWGKRQFARAPKRCIAADIKKNARICNMFFLTVRVPLIGIGFSGILLFRGFYVKNDGGRRRKHIPLSMICSERQLQFQLEV